MKLGWGYKITFLYLGFVSLIIFLVIKSMGTKTDLVSEDYYARELRYQQRITAIENARNLSQPFTFNIKDDTAILFFPLGSVSGNIFFFRPSDDKGDRQFVIEVDSANVQQVSLNELLKGMYKMEVSWNDGYKDYFVEETVIVK